ncbi:MAG TPA: hypothetical protein VMU95_34080 [Trebonia sp.]|nr:hypothetical protein [Trebonia sp.]
MSRALVACAAGLLLGTLVVTACASSPASSKASAPSCASQVATWEGTGVGADLASLPSQLNKTSTDVQSESGAGSVTGAADTSAAKADLTTLRREYKLLAAHQPPSCVRNLRADYATFLRFDNYVVNQELPAFIANPGDVIDGDLAWGHATYAAGLIPQVKKDLSGYAG